MKLDFSGCYYSRSIYKEKDNFWLSIETLMFCLPLTILRFFALKNEICPKTGRNQARRQTTRLSRGTLPCLALINECSEALSEQYARVSCFLRRHAFATAHNATIPNEAKYAS